MPKLSEKRKVIVDYWYTTAHINHVGQAWARAQSNRLFISVPGADAFAFEQPNQTGLRAEHLDHISEFPFGILLALNRGRNHWTSVPVRITKDDKGRMLVDIFFTDSLGDPGGNIPVEVQMEMRRIAELFQRKFGAEQVVITQSAYAHTWRQPDGSSCGPYSLENGQRCLENKGAEPNPGRQAIREKQLNLMEIETSASEIHSCSTSNEIDEILVAWMLHCIANQEGLAERAPFHVGSREDMQRLCAYYAGATHKNIQEVRAIFMAEYGHETLPVTENEFTDVPRQDKKAADQVRDLIRLPRFSPVAQRIRELVQSNDLVRNKWDPKAYEKHMKALRDKNTMKDIEKIRVTIAKITGDESTSYQQAAEFIEHVAKMNLVEALQLLTGIIPGQTEEDKQALAECELALNEMVGSRGVEYDYSRKLIGLAKAYRNIYTASQNIKTMEAAHAAPKALLEAQIKLLHSAINRNNASLLMTIGFVLQDFCASFAEILTLGYWVPDHKKIDSIRSKLETSLSTKATNEDYLKELNNLRSLCDSKKILGQEDTSIPTLPIR